MVDSLIIHDILRAGNLDEEQARAMTAAIQRAESDIALDIKAVMNQRFEAMDQRFDAMERRFDAMDQRLEAMERRFEEFSKQIVALIGNCATKAELSNYATKADLAELKAELVRWMFMFWAGHTAVILTVVFAAIKFLR